jgi:hypothetical protein
MKTTPTLRISALVLQSHTQHPSQAWRKRVATACCALLLASALPLAAQTPATGATTFAPAVASTDVPSTPEWQAWREQQAAERKLSAEQWMALEAPCHPVVQQQSDSAGMSERGIRRRILICVAEAEGEKARAEGEKARAGIAKAEAEGEKARAGIAKAEAEGVLQQKIISELAKPREKQDLATLKRFVGELQKFLPHTVVENQIKVLEEIIAMRRERKQP